MEKIARKMAEEAMMATESCMWKWSTSELAEYGIETYTDWEDFRSELEMMGEVEAVEFDEDGIFVCFFPEDCPNYEE